MERMSTDEHKLLSAAGPGKASHSITAPDVNGSSGIPPAFRNKGVVLLFLDSAFIKFPILHCIEFPSSYQGVGVCTPASHA